MTLGAFLLLLGTGLHAQEKTMSAVTTAGGEAQGNGGSQSFTIGQVFYRTDTSAQGAVAQGVQQPYEIFTLGGIETAAIQLELLAYPNPTRDLLRLSIGNYNNENLTYYLYDMQGKLLENKEVVNSTTTIDMNALPASNYLLNVRDDQKIITSFKIIKN